ncbi:hypothetical protein DMB92_00860 [Campylobacter sp. MIT 99-7217]|uniref:hypothetical protein n=1 Tax=Campylobacter sp. MIT 99-7217 TaxID=535091 RepID=UPI0011598D30|nr:hypothetical protein [Campylobacter sp. MIT 99-7217]TQR34547.1 hypothetical protein DMB92_00860 [Campylobacter sp. MIT 99-7217]
MKKAFSLFECLLALVISSLLIGIIFILFKNLFYFTNSQEKFINAFQNANITLIQIDKILQNCLKESINFQDLSCFLEDRVNLLMQKNQNIFIANSSLILKNHTDFYVPKAKLLQILKNHQDLYGFKNNTLLFYSLSKKQIYELSVIDDENISFNNASFEGFFKLIEARIHFFIQDEKLYYELEPHLKSSLKQKTLLINGVQSFEILKQNDYLIIKLCLFENNQKITPACFERISL